MQKLHLVLAVRASCGKSIFQHDCHTGQDTLALGH